MGNAEYKQICIDKLILDPQNPRLPKSMFNKSEVEIINFLLSDASLVELMLAIGKNGFFEGEQLLVVPVEENYIVVEGNRRLSAVKLLNEPSIASVYVSKIQQVLEESKERPNTLPCLVFQNKDDILKYLGFRHITGIKSWKALEKARYLTQLKDTNYPENNIQFASREIAKMIGSRRDYVLRVLIGYKLYEIIERNGFYRIKGLDDTTFYFNYLSDSLSRNNIEAFIGVNMHDDNPVGNVSVENLKDWTHWLFDSSRSNKIIADSKHLNLLNKVIGSQQALEAFKSGENINVAVEYTDVYDEQFRNTVIKALDSLVRADMLTPKVSVFYDGLISDLSEINQRIRKIKREKEQRDSKDIDDDF